MISKKLFVIACLIFSTLIFANDNQATVIKISGEASIEGVKISEGSIIYSGQTLKLRKPKDFADVKLLNGSIVRLAGGAVKFVTVTEKKSHFRLIRGIFYSLVQKLNKNETFTIHTKNASFAVRGTKFYIQESSDESYLCVCEGSVEAKKENKTLMVKKDQDLFVNFSKPFKIKTASKQMINMGNDVFKSMQN